MVALSFAQDPRGAALGAAAAARATLGSTEAVEAAYHAFAKHFESLQGLSGNVVSLNAIHCNKQIVPHGTLVHVRGMIQDMLSPEYYPAIQPSCGELVR